MQSTNVSMGEMQKAAQKLGINLNDPGRDEDDYEVDYGRIADKLKGLD